MILFLFFSLFSFYCKEKDTLKKKSSFERDSISINVKSNRTYHKNKFMILSKKLFPGRYTLKGRIIDINSSTSYFKINKIIPNFTNKLRNFIRREIFMNTINLKKEYKDLILSITLAEKLNKNHINIKNLGLGHYLAISGLHFAILVKMFEYCNFNHILILILSFIYSFVIFTPSSIRSFFNLFFKTVAYLLAEEYCSKKSFVVSLILSSLIFGIKDPSLNLSFFATSLLILLKDKGFLKKNLLISLLLSIPSIYFFKSYNILAFIPNILLSPLFTVIILLSFTTIFIPIPTAVLNICFSTLINIVDFISKFTIYRISLPIPLCFLIGLYSIVLYMIFIKGN